MTMVRFTRHFLFAVIGAYKLKDEKIYSRGWITSFLWNEFECYLSF